MTPTREQFAAALDRLLSSQDRLTAEASSERSHPERVKVEHGRLMERRTALLSLFEFLRDRALTLDTRVSRTRAALHSMVIAFGMHGPCRNHSCTDCKAAYANAIAELNLATEPNVERLREKESQHAKGE